jgi:sugar phosphate isomerase/epimerase
VNNFLIGFYGRCDEEKYDRDFIDNFYGIEACMFPDIEEVQKLAKKSQTNRFHWGAHYPLIQKKSITRDPLLISLNREDREKAFFDFEKEAKLVSQYGGKYILTHFPKPVLISDTFDFTFWRFASDKEWLYEKDYPIEELDHNLYAMFSHLEEISKRHNIQVILENDAISQYLSQSSVLENLFGEFNSIKACLDIGRLHLQQMVDSEFKGMEFAKKLAPFTSLIHLWNTNPVQNLHGGHLPVSPSQKSEDGFADVRAYLEAIFARAKDAKILFEHNSNGMTREELQNCY